MTTDPSASELAPVREAVATAPREVAPEQGGTTPAGSVSQITRTLGTTLAIQGLGVVSGVVVARLLGVDSRGELAAVILWPSVIAYLGDLGGPLAYSFQSSRSPGSVLDLIRNVPYLVTAQWVVLGLIGPPIIIVALGRYGTTAIVTSVAVLLAYVPFSFTARYLNAVNQGTGAFKQFNATRLAVPLAYVAGVVALAGAGIASVPFVAAAVIASNVVALVVVFRGVRRRFGPAFHRPRPNLGILRQSLAYGLRGHVGNLTPVDSMQLDLLLVTALLGAHDAGLYSVAIAAAMIIRTQGTAFGLVALPAVAGESTPELRLAAGARIFRACLLLTVFTAGVVALVAPILLPVLYGSGFRGAVPILEILAGAMVLASLRQVLGDMLRGIGQPGLATLSEVGSWVVAIAALAILLPPYRAVGAAVGVTISYAAALALSLIFVSRSGISVTELFRVGPGDLRAGLGQLRTVAGRVRLARKVAT